MMKQLLLLFFISFICLPLNGCNTNLVLSQAGTVQNHQPLLHFQKTPCLGTCPAYNAMIFENGSVSFTEFKNALAQDTVLLQLPAAELEQLKIKIKELNYQNLEDSYPTQWSDMSSTYLTFYEGGKEVKLVQHEEGGPEQLVEFQNWLHTLVWQRAEEQKRPTY